MNSMIQTVDLTKKFNDFVANDHINLDVNEEYALRIAAANKRKNPDPGERSYTEQPG